MLSEEIKKAVLGLEVGSQIEIKPKMTTYTIYRVSDKRFELDCTSGGWVSAVVCLKEMEEVLSDTEKFYELNWK